MPWPQPENITSMTLLFKYTWEVYPMFPGLILAAIFFVGLLTFKTKGPLPNAMVASGWITLMCATFFSLMGVLGGNIVVFIAIGEAFCMLWLWKSQSSGG